jgi:hypothetical protein
MQMQLDILVLLQLRLFEPCLRHSQAAYASQIRVQQSRLALNNCHRQV